MINSTISRDTTQIEQAGTQVNLPGLVTRLDESPQLSSVRRSSSGLRSPSLLGSQNSELDEDFNGEADSGGDSGSDGDSSEHSSVSTDVSDDSRASARQYKWRKRLQARKLTSLLRHQHISAGTAPGLLETASSLPDLGLYKTWDPKTTLKVSIRYNLLLYLLLQPGSYY